MNQKNTTDITGNINEDITGNIISDFFADYLEDLSRYSINEIAEKLDMKLLSFSDISVLADTISLCIFADMFHHKPFLDSKILGYYVDDDTHYFPIEQTGICHCKHCDIYQPLYRCIYVSSPTEFGLTEEILYKGTEITSHDYKTVRDILPFLEEHSTFLDSAFILQGEH